MNDRQVMGLVFLNRYYAPDTSATSLLLTDLCSHLAAQGEDVHVIASRQLYGQPKAVLPKTEVHNGVTVHRAWSTRFGRRRHLGRVLDYVTFYIGAALILWSLARGRVVVAKTDPPLISVVAALCCRVRGGKMISWQQDVYPELVDRLGGHRLPAWIIKLIKALRNWSMKAAVQNVVLGRRMKDWFVSEGISEGGLTIIPNWAVVNPSPVDLEKVRGLAAQWKVSECFVVMYSGNMGMVHEFQSLIEAAERLRGQPNILFLFVGDGAKKSWLVAEAKRRELPNIRFLPYQDLAVLNESLSVADLHVVSLRPDMEGLVVPSKFYGILACGRPTLFIGDPCGELALEIKQHDVGVACDSTDVDGIVRAIQTYVVNESLAVEHGMQARRLFEVKFDRRIAMALWCDVLRDAQAKLGVHCR